jgi:hypothetical protein
MLDPLQDAKQSYSTTDPSIVSTKGKEIMIRISCDITLVIHLVYSGRARLLFGARQGPSDDCKSCHKCVLRLPWSQLLRVDVDMAKYRSCLAIQGHPGSEGAPGDVFGE